MAQQVLVRMIDDLDGTEADRTVRFGLDGASYEIDLSDRNAGRLREAMASYLPHARRMRRRIGGRGERGTRVTAQVNGRLGRDTARRIRVWAGENGHQVAERGRIPDDVIDAYERRGQSPDRARAPKAVGARSTGAVGKDKAPRRTTSKAAAARKTGGQRATKAG